MIDELDRIYNETAKSPFVIKEDLSFDIVDDLIKDFDILLEAVSPNTHIIVEKIYPKVEAILQTPVGDRKFKQLVGQFMDRNSDKLHTSGPAYMIPFGDIDKGNFFSVFDINPKEIQTLVKEITTKITAKSDFKLLRNNPIFWLFYCVIRYYTIKNDTKGLNSSLAIFALATYPSIYSNFFKYGTNVQVMQYTIDTLSNKYLIKQAGDLFGGLFLSIQHSYDFLKPYIQDASDGEIIRFIQRIHNDQKSMIKNICDEYMKNYQEGKKATLTKGSFDEIQVDIDSENNTTVVDNVTQKVANPILTSGVDLKRASNSAKLAGISIADCRYYLSQILTDKYNGDIYRFVSSILFLYIYMDNHTVGDINSSNFITWSAELYRKTNSNDDNIQNIKTTLDKWAEETGVHKKFKREASRVNYKKAIFWYFIFSIQYYNK